MGTVSLSFLGFMTGILVCDMVLRWAQAIAFVVEKHWTYGETPTQHRTTMWALPIVLGLHSAPWAILVIVAIAYAMPISDGWMWFFGGFVFAIVFMSSLVVVGLVQARKFRPRATIGTKDAA